MANTLLLRLEGPMQSWGERARWGVRDSAPEPTKSGVVGLLACALGISEDEDVRNLSRQIRFGARCDRPGSMIVDYHTVVEGVMTAEGKIKINSKTKKPETVESWRDYLCDASFLVAIQGAPDLIDRLALALQNPYWPPYLGRKSCPPSLPFFEGLEDYPSLEAALKSWKWRWADFPDRSDMIRLVIECSPGEGVRRRHEIESRLRRTFGPVYTRDLYFLLEDLPKEGACI